MGFTLRIKLKNPDAHTQSRKTGALHQGFSAEVYIQEQPCTRLVKHRPQ